MEYQKYAVIDIGSNSLRLMTGWQEVPGTWIFSPKELATTRLGKDIDETHHLSPAGMEASFAAMEGWKEQLTGVPVCAVATSAVREAIDGQAFLAEVRARFGWHTRISSAFQPALAFLAEVRARFGWHCRAISGLEEASLSFTGATASLSPDVTAAVIDIGGGSSEVAVGRGGDLCWSHSYPMGAVRFTRGEVMSHQAVAHLEKRCYQEWLPMQVQPDLLIGVGGTLTTLAAMDLQLAVYDAEKVEGHRVSYDALCGHIERLQAMTPEERRHVPGLQPKRSDIIVAGLLIAKSFLQRYHIPAITVSERDLMEGVFFRHSFHDAAWNSRDRQS